MTISKTTVRAVLFALILLAVWTPAEYMPGIVTPLRYAVFLLCSIFIIVTAYMAKGFRVPLTIEAILIAAFLFYVTLSALWSTRDADTYIKGLLIFSALLTALSVSRLFTLDEVFRIVFAALASFLVVSVMVAVLVPSIGLETGWEHAGKWRGLSGQKNGMGADASLTLVMALALPLRIRTTPRAQFLALAGRAAIVMIAATALYMAGSRGAQLMALIGIGSLAIARLPKIVQRVSLLAVALFSVPLINLAVSTFFIDADKIGILGTTINTNSRTTIWEYGLRQMEGRELLGYGVNGFWTAERMAIFKDVHGWVLDNFHNGYITILIEGGIVGFSLFVLGLGFVYLLLLIAIGSLRDSVLSLIFAFVNMFAVNNLVENVAGRSTSLSIIVFATIAFLLRPYILSLIPLTREKPVLNQERGKRPRLTVSKPAVT